MQTVAMNPGSLEPVTIEEVKTYARVASGSVEDDLIGTLIGSARAQCEEFARIAIAPREWRTSYRVPVYSGYGMGLGGSWHDPENVIKGLTVPRAPVISVDSLQWVLNKGPQFSQNVPEDEWVFDETSRRIHWVGDFDRPPENAKALLVTYQAGYPAEEVEEGDPQVCIAPDPIKTAVMIQAAHMYENRASEKKVMMPQQVVELLRGFWQSASVA